MTQPVSSIVASIGTLRRLTHRRRTCERLTECSDITAQRDRPGRAYASSSPRLVSTDTVNPRPDRFAGARVLRHLATAARLNLRESDPICYLARILMPSAALSALRKLRSTAGAMTRRKTAAGQG